MTNISLISGDITKAEVDAIVNAANSFMLGGGGVDGAIHRAAGPTLLEACRRVPDVAGTRCPVGEARITEAGNLQAKFVIHTVGPRHGIDTPSRQLLRSAFESSLQLAVAHGCRSVAFPAISCGVYGYPIAEAAEVAFLACGQDAYKELDIQFYLYPQDVYVVWQNVFKSKLEG